MTSTWIITTTPQISALLDLAHRASPTVTAVAVGDVAVRGADSVISVPLPDGTPAEALAPAVAEVVAAAPGDLVLAADRAAERVLAGAVAARLDAPVLTGVTAVDGSTVTVARYGGITVETVRASGPAVVIAAGGSAADGETVAAEVAASSEAHPLTVSAVSAADVAEVDLGTAKRIVSGGRGFKAKEELGLLDELASALGAEVACSRPLAETVDWMPKSRYVGVSGQKVKPDIYVAVGISGQMQHMAGARDARTIVAINSDGDAPIFAQADYGIVGDLHEVLPALTRALR
ncbi:electron transfer flavoprotein subunit alpha/FixB family protein [Actinomyces israelii]|uniref:Electron transfer flavoprotein subunit alpha/FixB family protein n=1 Tax=Actinomyces israelii TaxID=1659 RepID=A0ABT4I6P8_9ACTO|nr:electron transfer flavoprotein subunit alpha/FixB family protein [Actinomyces israelii]MCZ0857414.1 electron transfer flavoprotein subunit alpha/FixB family protein [Actinomyces israelii]WKR21546.1 Protein FixB [Actinomyces israelii]